MIKRLIESLSENKRVITAFGVVFFIFCAVFRSPVVSAEGGDRSHIRYEKDLLLRPAAKTDIAPYSILMDVVRVNGGLFAVGERGHIIFADTGCITWTQSEVPVSVNLTAVTFTTDQKGWAVGHDGIVLYTEDSGKTWVKKMDGMDINDIVLAQVNHLIQTKTEMLEDEVAEPDEARREELAMDIENLDLFRTDLYQIQEEGPTRPLMDIWFKNEQEGLILGTYGTLLRTADGGKTWESLYDKIENTDGLNLYGITRSGDDLFMAGEWGILYRSEDFGRTWQTLESPYEGSYFSILGDPEGGFVTAFGLRGNIFYSLDRGETWHRSENDNTAPLLGGAFLADGSFCIIGADGMLHRSSDRGKTLKTLDLKFPGAISVTEIKRGVLAVVGLRGFKRISLD